MSPASSFRFTSAPSSMRCAVASAWPHSAAHISGVTPLSSASSTNTELRTNASHKLEFPSRAACLSVSPLMLCGEASLPRWNPTSATVSRGREREPVEPPEPGAVAVAPVPELGAKLFTNALPRRRNTSTLEGSSSNVASARAPRRGLISSSSSDNVVDVAEVDAVVAADGVAAAAVLLELCRRNNRVSMLRELAVEVAGGAGAGAAAPTTGASFAPGEGGEFSDKADGVGGSVGAACEGLGGFCFADAARRNIGAVARPSSELLGLEPDLRRSFVAKSAETGAAVEAAGADAADAIVDALSFISGSRSTAGGLAKEERRLEASETAPTDEAIDVRRWSVEAAAEADAERLAADAVLGSGGGAGAEDSEAVEAVLGRAGGTMADDRRDGGSCGGCGCGGAGAGAGGRGGRAEGRRSGATLGRRSGGGASVACGEGDGSWT